MTSSGTLTLDLVRDLTDTKTWQRGLAYFEEGRVVSVEHRGGWVHGKVAGTHRYRCELREDDGGLDFACTCPVGCDGVLCKHVVATALAYLNDLEKSPTGSSRKGTGQTTLVDVQRYLQELGTESLVELVMDRLDEDDEWREVLLRTAALHRPSGADVGAIKQSITKATRTGSFLDYHDSIGFANGLSTLCDSLAELIEAGYADDGVELIEYALKRCEKALGNMDDSSGCMGEILHRLQELHLQACGLSKQLKPKKLAKRLFDWQLSTGYDIFFDAAETYAEILGEEGVTKFYTLAHQRWSKLADRAPGADRFSYEGDRFKLQSMVESLARAKGDIDDLVQIKQKDLSSPYQFFKIADVYREAARLDDAIDWAERGIKAFPAEQRDTRVHLLLADLYQQAKRHDDAVQVIWPLYDKRPELETYIHLKHHAEQVRVNSRKSKKPWRQWRDRALVRLREDIEQTQQHQASLCDRPIYRPNRDADHSRLVDIFLWEGDTETAWQEAQAGGCRESLWLKLAEHRELEHPADAIAVYQELVPAHVEQTNTRGYEEAMILIRRIHALMPKAKMAKQFPKYQSTLRESYKRKRKFVQMLDILQG
ncbi:MAG: DUF6880 family protein [Planctomycetota bacterium]